MFRSTVFKRSVSLGLLLCLLSMFACQKHESVEGVSTDPPPEPDVVVDDGKNEGYAYLAGNPFHERRMDELTGMANVLATVNSLRYRGFELSPENSFTMCGVADDASVTVTFIALAGGSERAGQTATLACYDSGGYLLCISEYPTIRHIYATRWQSPRTNTIVAICHLPTLAYPIILIALVMNAN